MWERVIKTVAVSLLMSIAILWLRLFIPWGLHHPNVGKWIWLWSELFLVGMAGLCISILLMNKENFRRVLVNIMILVTSGFVGWFAADLNNHFASHRYVESQALQEKLLSAIFFLLIGYVMTLVRELAGRSKKND